MSVLNHDKDIRAALAIIVQPANLLSLSKGDQRVVVRGWLRLTDSTSDNPTPELGPGWAICRATPRNLERYAKCITRKQYEDACERAMRASITKFINELETGV